MNWNQSTASGNGHLARWLEPTLGSWNILWDNSNDNMVEMVATKDNGYVYFYRPTRGADRHFNSLSDIEKIKLLANELMFFDDVLDLKSWLQTKNEDRFKNIVV